jgi:hypothetical protein
MRESQCGRDRHSVAVDRGKSAPQAAFDADDRCPMPAAMSDCVEQPTLSGCPEAIDMVATLTRDATIAANHQVDRFHDVILN